MRLIAPKLISSNDLEPKSRAKALAHRPRLAVLLGLGLVLAGCGDSGIWPRAEAQHSTTAYTPGAAPSPGQVQSTTLVDTTHSASTRVERRRIDPRPDTLLGVFR